MDIITLAKYKKTILLNVWELYEEANWLHEKDHYARAYALGHLSFEENAKITVLDYLAMEILADRTTPESVEEIFTSELFINHNNKLRIAFLNLSGFDYQETVEMARKLNRLKNKSLYAEIYKSEMSKPSDIFTKVISHSMIVLSEYALETRVIELGGENIEDVNRITAEMIENIYEEMKSAFLDALPDEPSLAKSQEGVIDFLKLIIKNERMFNDFTKSRLRHRGEVNQLVLE